MAKHTAGHSIGQVQGKSDLQSLPKVQLDGPQASFYVGSRLKAAAMDLQLQLVSPNEAHIKHRKAILQHAVRHWTYCTPLEVIDCRATVNLVQ